LIVCGRPLVANVEFGWVDRVDKLEVDGCRTSRAGGLCERLGLGEDTFVAVVGLEGPDVLAGGSTGWKAVHCGPNFRS